MLGKVNLSYLLICIFVFCVLPVLSLKMGVHFLIHGFVWAACAVSYPIALALTKAENSPWKSFGQMLLMLSLFQVAAFAIYFVREKGYLKQGDFTESSVIALYVLACLIVLASISYWLGFGVSRLLVRTRGDGSTTVSTRL
jgi:hypothetical protein